MGVLVVVISRNNVKKNLFLKRLIDILISALALLVLSPILALTALLIRFRMGSPILFKQIRPGLHDKPFIFYKFRTMTCDCDENGCPLPDECRLTRLGLFLRRTSIDELPQFWNVLKGDMSIVGPRPLLMEYLPLYTTIQARRHEVKPGVVGWAVVNGRNSCSWEEKFDLDVWYVYNWSLDLDLKIILIAIRIVLSGRGLNQEGCATVERFTGARGSSE
jgi:sugar transferase EpsL